MRHIAFLFLILAFAVAVILPNDIGTLNLPAIGVKAVTKSHNDSLHGKDACLIACATPTGFFPDRMIEALEFQALQVRGTPAGPPLTPRLVI